MRVRIYENLRVVSYAPCYLAEALGCFAARGLEADIVRSPSPAETAEGLLTGRVDVAWGGPMRVMLHHDRDPHCPLVCFCVVVGPEPFVLVGRDARPGFRLADLGTLTVGVVSEVPTPWLLLQEDLRRAGIDPDTIARGAARSMAENVAALTRGEIDVAQVMEPHTEVAIAAGAHLWHAFATRGDVAFTSFYTTRDFLEQRPDVCQAISDAMRDALGAARDLPLAEVVLHLAPRFPDLDPVRLQGAVARYRALGIWPRATALTPAAFVRLKGSLLSGGFIRTDVPYAAAVADRFSTP